MNQLPIRPDAPWLAPLAGWSDLPFRVLCRELGAAVCCTEMVSAKGLVYGGPRTAVRSIWELLLWRLTVNRRLIKLLESSMKGSTEQ